MIIDGRAIATEILTSVRGKFEHVPIVRAVTCAPSPATLSYLRIKEARATEAGMKLEVVHLQDTATEEDIIRAVTMPGADGVIVQLPLPDHITVAKVVNAIPLSKDADVLSERAYAAFEQNESGALMPPVVCAIAEVLLREGVDVRGKHVSVIGHGKLVGQPAALWLTRNGAEVSVSTRDQGISPDVGTADIIISGAGSPGLITPDQVQEGVVLIDAGTSEQGGQVVGDADPSCATRASVFTPVPGGMGPIAVACLFRNVATLLERSLQE